MASYYVPLPAAQMPRNAMLDFSPVNNAIDGVIDQRNRNRQFGMQREQLDMQKDQQLYQRGRDQRTDARQDAVFQQQQREWFGKSADAVSRMSDPAQRAAAWKNIVAKHPSAGNLPPEYLDPMRGPSMVAAEFAGLARDPMDAQMKQAQLAQIRAQTSALGQKNSLNEAIAGMINGMGAAPPAAPQGGPSMSGQPQVIPQSNTMMPEAQNPLLIQTAGGSSPSPAPAQQPDTVQTPLGPMSMERAQRMGFVLGLAGKGDAGKIFVDAANQNRLGKEATNTNDKDQIAAVNTIARLEGLRRSFDPKFLEIPTRMGMEYKNIRDKFGLLSLQDKAELARFSKFKSRGLDSLARYVKDMSGVAVAEAEYNRLAQTLPNPGSGVLDAMGPTQFKSVMDDVVGRTKMAVARMNYLRSQGFSGKPWDAGIELDDMKGIVDRRAVELEQSLQGKVAPDQMRSVVSKQLKQEFGI